jgi:hypothetical protein
MRTTPSGDTGLDSQASDKAEQRMLASRDEIRRRFFSPEALANEYPADAPEVVGLHTPAVTRDTREHPATR